MQMKNPMINYMLEDEEDLVNSMAQPAEQGTPLPALDSQQAGAKGGSNYGWADQMGKPPGNSGAFGWAEQMANPQEQMPEAYSQNRMESWGMPGFMQKGEQVVDKYRANKWQKGQDELASSLGASDVNAKPGHPVDQTESIQVDEVQMLAANGDPMAAFQNAQQGGGSAAARGGAVAGGLFSDWVSAQTGGMFG